MPYNATVTSEKPLSEQSDGCTEKNFAKYMNYATYSLYFLFNLPFNV